MLQVYNKQLQIRAKAVRDAYADLNSETTPEKRINAIIGAPSTANMKYQGSLGQVRARHFILLTAQ